MEYNEILIHRIEELCDKKNISVYTFCKMNNIGRSTVNNILLGITQKPSIQTIHRIANGFNMTLSEFLDIKELNEYEFESKEDDE